jgi:hypothetical protein
MTAVNANGPIGFNANGHQYEIPLSALSFDSAGGAPKATGWGPYKAGTNTFKDAVDNWLASLYTGGFLTPAKQPAPVPAMDITAVQPGANGNTIKVTISNVHETTPNNFLFDAVVTEKDVYTGLDVGTIAGVIGTSSGGGTRPGLVFVTLGTGQPKGGTYTLSGTPAKVDIPNHDTTPATAFTLTARTGGVAALFTVTLTEPDAQNKFDLTVEWSKPDTNLTPATMATSFNYEINVAAPSGGSLGVPAAGSTTLSGGANQTGAIPAKATLIGRS